MAEPDSPLEGLAREMVEWRARRDPAWATTQCYPGFDDKLKDVSGHAYEEEAGEVREFLARLKSTPGPRLDRDALAYALELRLFELTRERRFERDVDIVMEFLDHLFPLLLRTDRPPAERARSMAARLEAAGAFFEAGRTRLKPPAVPPLWIRMAHESIEAAPTFLAAILQWSEDADLPEAARMGVRNATQTARIAIEAYAAWLQDEIVPVADGGWALGEDLFEELIARRHLPFTPESLMDLGARLVGDLRKDLEVVAETVLAQSGREALPGHAVEEARKVVQMDHPATFHEVLDAYRESIEAARGFVRERGLATLPGDAPLDVVETPGYLRHIIPFAAYIEPGRWQREARGTYLVTPKVDLSAFPRADIRNTTVHEAYPGHHLQLTWARAHPSLTRLFTEATELIEGWGLYSEAMMSRHAYTSTPAERFVRTRDALWRAVRIVLDVGLHTGRFRYEEAVERLEEETGMTREEAEAEVKRYTLTPSYNLSYMVGKIALEDLARRMQEEEGVDEREFHDRVLQAGSLPIPLLHKAVRKHSPSDILK